MFLIKTLQEWPSDALTEAALSCSGVDRALTIQDDPHRPEVYTGIVPCHDTPSRGQCRGGAVSTCFIPGGHVLQKPKSAGKRAVAAGSVSAPALQTPPGLRAELLPPSRLTRLTPLPYFAHVVSLTTNPSTSGHIFSPSCTAPCTPFSQEAHPDHTSNEGKGSLGADLSLTVLLSSVDLSGLQLQVSSPNFIRGQNYPFSHSTPSNTAPDWSHSSVMDKGLSLVTL